MAYNFGGTDWGGALPLTGVQDFEKSRVRGVIASDRRNGGVARSSPDRVPTDNESFILHHFTTEIERARTYLYAFHRQWYINIAAVLGSSGVAAESIARMARVKMQRPEHRINHQSNLVGGNVRRLVGYLARSNPDMQFVPADPDDPFQIDAAGGARRWLDWQWTYDNWKKKELDLLMWAVCCGIGVSAALHDPTGGPIETAVDDETGEPLTFQDGRPMVNPKTGRPLTFATGIAHTSVIPAFHYVYGISARTDEELNWNGTQSWQSFRYLESFIPGVQKLHRLSPEPQFTNTQSMYERQVMQTMGPQMSNAGASPESNEPGVVVSNIFVAPRYLPAERFGDELHEQGAFLMFAQGRVLELKPNPFMELEGVNPRLDWNPYTIWPCNDVPGRMIGQGSVENQLPVIEGRNFVISRIREAQRMTGQPKVLIPKGTTQVKITNEAGQQVTFNPAMGPPSYMQPALMPSYIFNLLELLDHDLERVASQPPMLQGRAQGQVRSGLGVQLLQEQALTEFTALIARLDVCRARHARQLLLREIQFSDSARRVPHITGSGEWTQDLFFAKNMNPDFMVRIVPGTSIPQSKALVMSEIDRLVAWGALQPQLVPQHAQAVLRAMKYEVPSFTPDDQEQALNQARYENAVLLERAGDEPLTLPSFNHPVHINEHLRQLHSRRAQERITKEREQFGGRSPYLERMYKHIGLHMGHLQAKAMGVMIPGPVMPFEDLAVSAAGAAEQQAGPGGVTSRTGAQNGTTRGAPMPVDQMQNQATHGAVGAQSDAGEDGGGTTEPGS